MAAIAQTFCRNPSLAWWIAADRVTVLRLAIVPKPIGIAAVSASEMTTSSGATFHRSATIWEKIVSIPWPCAQAPDPTYTLPEGSIRTVAPSNGPTPVPST